MQTTGRKHREGEQGVLGSSLKRTSVSGGKNLAFLSPRDAPSTKPTNFWSLGFNELKEQKGVSSYHYLRTTSKLELLREQIRTGTYHIDYYRLAEKLLDFI